MPQPQASAQQPPVAVPPVGAPNPLGAVGALAVLGVAGGAVLLAALTSFLAALREMHRRWLVRELGSYGHKDDVAAVIAQEMLLEDAFATASLARVQAALPAALAISDPAQRAAAVQRIFADEDRYAQQRSEAMAARAIAAMGRARLRRESPLGAFWRLGFAQHHTDGCEFMADKFWPWAVLDRVHPPRHYGCTSSLHSFGEAIHAGWMKPSDVPDPARAVRAAAGVVMEQQDADAVLRELVVRERLLEAGIDADVLALCPFRGSIEIKEEVEGGTAEALQAAE